MNGPRHIIRILPGPDGQINITDTAVKAAFDEWYAQIIDYLKLEAYYNGDHPFNDNRDDDGARVVTNFCQYITDAISGYITGNPITYSCADGDTAAEEVLRHHATHDGQEQDADVLFEASKYGRAYKLLYHDDDGALTPKCTVLKPTQAFVCYTGTVEPVSLFGAVVSSIRNDKNVITWFMDLYTASEVQHWSSTGPYGPWAPIPGIPNQPHKFGRVPLVEYRNNKEAIGDFEKITTLQDAYNAVMSDRVDDKDSFATAMLAIQGQILGTTPDEVKEGAKEIKKSKVLQLDEDANIQYITKTLNEADTQVLADAIAANIHKISMVPDMTDKEFSANASGVAMLYKLYGTDALAARKLTQFRKAQRYYFKAIEAGLHNDLASPHYISSMDMAGLKIDFKPKVPADIAWEAQTMATYASTGLVSKDTLRGQISFIDDPKAEAEKVKAEAEEDGQREKKLYADEFGYKSED